MWALFRFIYRFVNALVIMIVALSLLGMGMLFGSFYLLDLLVKGEEIETPRVVYMPESDAIKRLVEHGLFPDPIDYVTSDYTPPGVVVDQRPFPGSRVKKGRRVALTVSSGPQRVQIPNLVGRSEADLMYDLRGAGLEPGLIARVHHSEAPVGRIISQFPPSGPQVVQARRVNALISLGPPIQSFVMPNYVGETVEEARRQILRQPFLFDELIEVPTSNPSDWNRVIRQRPEPGARISEEDAVALTIGVQPRIEPTPTPIPQLEIEIPHAAEEIPNVTQDPVEARRRSLEALFEERLRPSDER